MVEKFAILYFDQFHYIFKISRILDNFQQLHILQEGCVAFENRHFRICL